MTAIACKAIWQNIRAMTSNLKLGIFRMENERGIVEFFSLLKRLQLSPEPEFFS